MGYLCLVVREKRGREGRKIQRERKEREERERERGEREKMRLSKNNLVSGRAVTSCSHALCWLAFLKRLSLLRLHLSSLWPQGTQETYSLPCWLFYKQCLETMGHYHSFGQPVRLSMPLCVMPLISLQSAASFP
jgi:hypothetical protein